MKDSDLIIANDGLSMQLYTTQAVADRIILTSSTTGTSKYSVSDDVCNVIVQFNKNQKPTISNETSDCKVDAAMDQWGSSADIPAHNKYATAPSQSVTITLLNE